MYVNSCLQKHPKIREVKHIHKMWGRNTIKSFFSLSFFNFFFIHIYICKDFSFSNQYEAKLWNISLPFDFTSLMFSPTFLSLLLWSSSCFPLGSKPGSRLLSASRTKTSIHALCHPRKPSWSEPLEEFWCFYTEVTPFIQLYQGIYTCFFFFFF